MSSIYTAAEPREKQWGYKPDVDTEKYPSEFLRRRNTQQFNVCHNQGRLVCVTQAYITGNIWGYLVKQQCTVHITIIFLGFFKTQSMLKQYQTRIQARTWVNVFLHFFFLRKDSFPSQIKCCEWCHCSVVEQLENFICLLDLGTCLFKVPPTAIAWVSGDLCDGSDTCK